MLDGDAAFLLLATDDENYLLSLPLPGGRARTTPPPPGGPGRLDSRMPGYLPSLSERMPVTADSVPRG
ncbi:hypothetical protein STANM309S_04647 [Streptomyces tanashiensis]